MEIKHGTALRTPALTGGYHAEMKLLSLCTSFASRCLHHACILMALQGLSMPLCAVQKSAPLRRASGGRRASGECGQVVLSDPATCHHTTVALADTILAPISVLVCCKGLYIVHRTTLLLLLVVQSCSAPVLLRSVGTTAGNLMERAALPSFLRSAVLGYDSPAMYQGMSSQSK
jgi:hypothetical protein